ncbi:MAG: DUF302 domain-containing protein [bacterium]
MKNIILSLFVWACFISVAFAGDHNEQQFSIEQTVYRIAVEDDVSADDVRDALQSKAAELNMKLVAHQPVSKELQARGVESGVLEIFQFCNPGDARKMVDFSMIFAAYMPCRIAMVEDKQHKLWLMMINLDMLINSTPLPADVKEIADKVNNTLKIIIHAGAEGDF